MSKLWGGRFSKKTNKRVEKFTSSIHFDQKLAKYDCIGSLYHIDVLKKAKLLSASEHKKLKTGLERILTSIETGSFFKSIDDSYEDIHSYMQSLLEKKSGKVAYKLHTCRSRNDQITFDVKLYCLDNIAETKKLLRALITTLQRNAKKYTKVVMPGYTHLQHAIPIKLSHHLEAYSEMLTRDEKRLNNAASNINLTLGSGALAGTFISKGCYKLDPKQYLPGLKVKITAPNNALDTVSDRDFIVEILNALALVGMHLSRLSEDLILWSSQEFNFIDIDDAFCTGSSLMPQKKNPDILELIRGYAGRLYSNTLNVLVMMKGLPLSYNRDMQHDKEPLFDSFQIVQNELDLFNELFKNIKIKKANIARQLDDESLYATDLADYLVQNKVPFKEAHSIIGKLIQTKLKKQTNIVEMDSRALATIHPLLTKRVVQSIINPQKSVASKKSVK